MKFSKIFILSSLVVLAPHVPHFWAFVGAIFLLVAALVSMLAGD
jgi:hypothetical protein